MAETIKLSKGDSCTIQVVVPNEIIADINEIVVSLGNNLSARISDNTLTQVGNIFTWKIKSVFTKNLGQNLSVITAIDRDGYGIRKSKVETAPKISFAETPNPTVSQSTSDFIDLAINYSFDEKELVVNGVFMNIFRGKSALDLYCEEKELPNATFDEMMSDITGKERRNQFLNNVNYIGIAPSNSEESEAVWKITKLVVSLDGSITKTVAINAIWNDRLTINYN